MLAADFCLSVLSSRPTVEHVQRQMETGIVISTVAAYHTLDSANVTMENTTNASDGQRCITLQFQGGFVPWDNPRNLLSAETEATIERVKSAVVLPIFFLIGGPANLLNMAVFYRQGLRDRTNMCLFALSLADELYMMQCMLFNGERLFQLDKKDR